MKSSFLHLHFSLILVLVFASCDHSEDPKTNDIKVNDSLQKALSVTTEFAKISNAEGVVGVVNVPEMLTICKLDSAPIKDVSFKVAKDYSILEEEMNAIGAAIDGMPGMITYTNDTSNFVFECVLPIKEMPKKAPKHCKIVVLEATPMLAFNFYGPYEHLFAAYDKIKKYNASHKLQQCGPMREFYLSDPIIEKDPAKWQTRILVPVMPAK